MRGLDGPVDSSEQLATDGVEIDGLADGSLGSRKVDDGAGGLGGVARLLQGERNRQKRQADRRY